MLERPVIGTFGICRETAGGKLPAVQVIAQTIAARGFFGARFIAAVAVLLVLRLLTFHY